MILIGMDGEKQQIHRLEAYIIAFGCIGKSTVSWVLHFYGVSSDLWHRDVASISGYLTEN